MKQHDLTQKHRQSMVGIGGVIRIRMGRGESKLAGNRTKAGGRGGAKMVKQNKQKAKQDRKKQTEIERKVRKKKERKVKKKKERKEQRERDKTRMGAQ